MIIQTLMNTILAVLRLLLAPINIPQFPDKVLAIFEEVLTYLETGAGILANYTDFNYLLSLMVILIAIDLGIKVYHFVMWIIRKIPMLGMS